MFGTAPQLPPFIATQFPFARRTYTANDHTLHFVDEGEGRPVLLIHGNPTWSFLWRHVIAQLDRTKFRCIAPDLLGFGYSSRLRDPAQHSLQLHAETICALVTALDLRDVILVGQDWGGPIAACVGARLPDRISGVVLGNTSVIVPKRPRGTLFHRFARIPLLSDFAFKVLGFPVNMLSLVQGDRSSIRGDVKRAYTWPMRTHTDRAGVLALARMVPSSPAHPTIPELKQGFDWISTFKGPLELVWGLNDPILGGVLDRHIAALSPRHITRTQAGHFLQEEVPDALSAAIIRVATP